MDIPECLGIQGYVCGIVRIRDQVHIPRRHATEQTNGVGGYESSKWPIGRRPNM